MSGSGDRWRAVTFLVAASLAVHAFATNALLFAGPEVAASLGVDVRELVRVIQLGGVGGLLVGTAVAWRADRRGPLGSYLAPLAGSGLLLAASGGGASALTIGASRALGEGLHRAAHGPAASVLATITPHGHRMRAFVAIAGAVMAAELAALPLGGVLVRTLGVGTTAVALGAAVVTVVGVTAVMLRDGGGLASAPAADLVGFTEGLRTAWSVRTFRRLAWGASLASFGTLGFVVFGSSFVAERYGLDAMSRGAVAWPAIACVTVAAVLVGRLLDGRVAMDPRRVAGALGGFLGVSAAAVALVGAGPARPVALGAFAVAAAGAVVAGPTLAGAASLVLPDRVRTQGLALLAATSVPALLLGLAWFGSLVESSGAGAPLAVAATFLLVGAAVIASAGSSFELDRRRVRAQDGAPGGAALDEIELLGAIACRGLAVAHAGTAVLVGVDLAVARGEVVAVTGTPGAGVSSLLDALAGCAPLHDGRVWVGGEEVSASTAADRARRGVVHVRGLDDVMAEHGGAPAPDGLVASALVAAERRAPRVLLLDDVTAGTTSEGRRDALAVIERLAAGGAAVVAAGFAPDEIEHLAASMLVLEAGEVAYQGPPDDWSPPGRAPVGSPAAPGTGRGPAEHHGAAVLALEVRSASTEGPVRLDDVSLELRDGQVLGITSADPRELAAAAALVAGRLPLTSGSVSGTAAVVCARDARLFGSLRVHEAVGVALDRASARSNLLADAGGLPPARREERRRSEHVDRVLSVLQLGGVRDVPVRQLSTGVRRVVTLACALAAEPRLLVVDRPSFALAAVDAAGLAPLVRRVQAETGCAMVVIDSDLTLLTRTVDELLVLHEGRVLTRGAALQVVADPAVHAALRLDPVGAT